MNPYIQSLRLRTLPLSVAGIILGAGLAGAELGFENCDSHFLLVIVLAILTALSLQILSNLSNELGDAQKGTDANQQERAAYGLQSGKITIRQMKGMIGLFLGLSVLFGSVLIYSAFGTFRSMQSLGFLFLGLLAVCGAVFYTLGKHNYGYIGLGDLGVFLFFGLLSTMGGYYLQTQTMTYPIALCGAAIGMPCVGVLNLNNIRDMRNDITHGKRTLASRLGTNGSRIYHTALLVICLALLCLCGHFWTLCIVPIWAWHLWFVWSHHEKLDKQMPVLMLTTLAVALLALIS